MSKERFVFAFEDIWVPPSNGLQAQNGWNVVVPKMQQTWSFDAAVIAHNGRSLFQCLPKKDHIKK